MFNHTKNVLRKLWHCWFCPADINTSHSTFIHHIHYCDIVSALSFFSQAI